MPKIATAPSTQLPNWRLLLLILTVSLGFCIIIWDYFEMKKVIDLYNTYYRPPERLNKPYQSYEKHDIPSIFWDDDTYARMYLLREMHDAHAWRWRWTYMDNAPIGRVVWWSSPYMWWVDGLTRVTLSFTGESYEKALENVASWANPLLHALLLVVLALVLPRTIGYWLTIGVVMLATVMPGPNLYDYKAFQCGHQAFHGLTSFLASLALMISGAGWVNCDERSFRRAKMGFIVSGLLLGLGVWTGAARQSVYWFFIGLGTIVTILFVEPRPEEKNKIQYQPHLWQMWGRSAALMSLIGYLIDYFPNHLGLTTLDINTPLHSFTLFCSGELLALLARMRHRPATVTAASLCKGLLFLIGLAILPVAAFFGPNDWLLYKNPDLTKMAAHIEESQPGIKNLDWTVIIQMGQWFGLLTLMPAIGAGILLFNRKLPLLLRVRFVFSAVPVILLVLTFMFFMRSWSFFLTGCLLMNFIALGLVIRHLLGEPRLRSSAIRSWTMFGLSAVFLAQILGFQFLYHTTTENITLGRTGAPELLEAAIQREIAIHLKLANPGKRLTFMAASMLGARLAYFAEGEAMGSQYENIGGITASMDFFSDTGSLEIAQKIAQDRKVDYVVVNVCQPFIDTTVRIPPERRSGAAGLTLGERLCLDQPAVPDWLEALPAHPILFMDYQLNMRVFKVLPDKMVMHFSSEASPFARDIR